MHWSPADHPRSSGRSPGISDRSPVIHPPESGDFGLESGARELGVPGMVVSESQSDGRYGPTRLRVQRRTPFSDRRNHVSDAERVKSVCWRGSPDPLQRPRSTGCWEEVSTEASRGRARFAVVLTSNCFCIEFRRLAWSSCPPVTHYIFYLKAKTPQPWPWSP